DGVDWRGQGGYVVAPPSLHVSGRRYRWFHEGPDTPIPAAEPWMIALVAGPPNRPPVPVFSDERVHAPGRRGDGGIEWATARRVRRLGASVPGERNSVLYWCACRASDAVGGGVCSRQEALEVLDALAATARQLGLTEYETDATIASAFTRGR